MFERYTEKARRAIFFARYESSQLGSPEITPEHLLLGLIRESKGLLNMLRVEIVELSNRLRQRVGVANLATSVALPLDDSCKRALAHAAEESDAMKHQHIGTEHLLLGVMRERGRAAQVLQEMGAPSVDELRKTIVESALNKEQEPSFPGIKMPLRLEVLLIDEEGNRELPRLRGLPRIGDAIVIAAGEAEERYRVVDVVWRCEQQEAAGEVTQTRIEVRLRKEAPHEV